MQLCFYFTLSAKKLFQWIFSWLSPFFQRKTRDAYNFLDTDTTFANLFCKITTKLSKTFLAKKDPMKYKTLKIVFVILKVETKGHSDVLLTFYKNHLFWIIIFIATIFIEFNPTLINLINIFYGSPSWNRQHHSQNIHPTESFISMTLFKILCLVTWA